MFTCPLWLAFIPGISLGEWLVILIVSFIVVGPRRMPQVARKIGRTLGKLQRTAFALWRQIDNKITDDQNNANDKPGDKD